MHPPQEMGQPRVKLDGADRAMRFMKCVDTGCITEGSKEHRTFDSTRHLGCAINKDRSYNRATWIGTGNHLFLVLWGPTVCTLYSELCICNQDGTELGAKKKAMSMSTPRSAALPEYSRLASADLRDDIESYQRKSWTGE